MLHTRARVTLAGLLVTATASTGVLSGSAVAAPVRPAELGTATAVTLVTGDVVTLGGPRGADVRPAPGREGIGFRTHTDAEGDVHVVPADAVAMVSSGVLDPRLFDVSELVRTGYAERGDLPLIVDYPGARPMAAGARAVRELPSVGAVAVRAEKSPVFWRTARTSASRIWLDGPVRASLDRSVSQIGAPEAWAAGHTGDGVTVAVLDSGIDTTHPDLADAVVEAQDFTGSETGADDHFGHGTHIASIITGAGDPYRGVAPDAELVNGKVLDDSGGGFESGIIAGMEWAAARADVVNMSLGTITASDGTDPMSLAVNRLTEQTGALFVVAAGNFGPRAESVGSPGAADGALTVGAVDRDDAIAEFSSRGPRAGDGAIKPDITAPGVDIVAAKAAHGWIGDPAGDGYVSMPGTSMATPHVAGAAAILAEQHPDWRAGELKSTLMSTAATNAGASVFDQGAGRVDVAAATTASMTAAPGSLSFGTALWPHHDDPQLAKTVTYTNSGTAPVTLDVTTDIDAPAGMFTVSPGRVTVPAGGSADVTVTADTRVGTEDGAFSGALVATGGGTALRTPVTVHREVESYDVTFNLLDRAGNPTAQYGVLMFDYAIPSEYRPYDESGTVTVRLPKGTYFFASTVVTDDGGLIDMNEPRLVVDAPAEYTFDAREAVPVGFTVDRPDATAGWADLLYQVTTGWADLLVGWELSSFDNVWVRPSRTAAPGDFEFSMAARLARPDGTGEGYGFHASPYLYHVRYTENGTVPADLARHVPDRQLTKVVGSHAVATPGMMGVREGFVTMPLPFTLTEYYTPGVEWQPRFYDTTSLDGFPDGVLQTPEPRTYQLGRTVRERWNVGVFGPRFAFDETSVLTLTGREGDVVQFSAGFYSDQNRDANGSTANFTDANTEILRDGEVIAEHAAVGYFFGELPPEEATYTVRTFATRPGRLSPRIDGEWTFRSAHTESLQPIPALAVRFAPDLDDHNNAPAGRKFRFPVYVQRNAAEHPGKVTTPVVEISYDDGRTWQPVRVTRHKDDWQAEVNHPRDAEFASLRWSVSDQAGNTAKATITHAYGLK